MENLAKAILRVMKEVKGIDKSMTVGTGSSSYKGVPDQEVKKIIGESMVKNGLTLLPIGVDPKTQISRWEEETFYNGKSNGFKQKQSVFTEVKTKYLLLHESGESQVIEGYGQGVDAQDKGAGKATTYALKYAMLYSFLVPTGKIDDTDNTHSDDIPAGKRVTEPTTDQKAAAMLKKPKQAAFDELVPENLRKEIKSAGSKKEVVKVTTDNPYWNTSEEFQFLCKERVTELEGVLA